jgi:hypothetical protein
LKINSALTFLPSLTAEEPSNPTWRMSRKTLSKVVFASWAWKEGEFFLPNLPLQMDSQLSVGLKLSTDGRDSGEGYPKLSLSGSVCVLQLVEARGDTLSQVHPTLIKKENLILLRYKEIRNGAVAKSYMRKGFLIPNI